MTTMFAFRLLLILSIVCDLAAWTWRDLEYTQLIADEMGRAKGDQTLLITAALFVLFAAPLWRAWRLSGALMIALTALAIVGRLVHRIWECILPKNHGIIAQRLKINRNILSCF